MVLFLAAANRDPRKWDEPERFDLMRQTSGHVGFGFGIHQCLGQMVARLEGELVLEALLPRIKSIRADRPGGSAPEQYDPCAGELARGSGACLTWG